MRALFFGLGATADEKELVRAAFTNPELLRIVRHKFVPTLSKDSPIGQVQDVWLGVEQMIFGASRDTIDQALAYKNAAIEMTESALALLVNPDGPQVSLQVSITPDDHLGIAMLARSQFIRHVEAQLVFLNIIANQNVETPQDAAKRARKDSTK